MSRGNFRAPLAEVTCVCGVTFRTTPKRIASGRGKYCSKACAYANRTRPSGLTYNLTKENPTSFKPGHQPWNKGKKTGHVPWNKGMTGLRVSPGTEFRPGENAGELNPNWRGDEVGYHALHRWLDRHYPKLNACEFCGTDKNLQRANKTGEYMRDPSDWLTLCAKCHRRYDIVNGLIGIVRERFS